MKEGGYFQKALADFTHQVASGGAIRHLTDLGYTVKQIMERLDYPTTFERVQKGVWERMIETGVILTKEPGWLYGQGIAGEDGQRMRKAMYVQDYDQYGKVSFRRVEEMLETECEGPIVWKEIQIGIHPRQKDHVAVLLREKRSENGENRAYMSCEFGLAAWREPEKYHAMMERLDERQKEYLTGLPWERRRLYHRLDLRMTEILLKLFEAGLYEGECFFLDIQEKVWIA